MTNFSITDGLLVGADFIASPNYNTRPPKNHDPRHAPEISGIVIHNISLPPSHFGQYNKNGIHFVKAFFQNKLNPHDHDYFKTIIDLQVSAHLFIERNGAVTQFVNFNDRAWHAGQSSFLGRANCNDYTIGIELEGDDYSPFTDMQYDVLSKIIVAIYQAYPATHRHLMGHSDIAPHRKSDPGMFFQWERLRKMIQQELSDAKI